MDIMLNGWLLYQTLACRIRARAAFYQASGAYGFRDQLQDGMALSFARPNETRAQILRAASRQFVEGDVQHWWLPHSGQGVRSRISDDRVWLAFAAATYIGATGDGAVLDEPVPFLDGPAWSPARMTPFSSRCPPSSGLAVRALRARSRPVPGADRANRPAADRHRRLERRHEPCRRRRRGESVWLGWLLVRTIELFAPLAAERDPERARALAARMRPSCARRWSASPGTATGTGARLTTTVPGLDRRGRPSAGSTRSPNPGRSSRAPPTPPRRPAMAALDRELIRRDDGWPCCSRRRSTRRPAIPVTSRAIRRACAKMAGNIQPRRDVGDPRLRRAGRGRPRGGAVFAAESDQPCPHPRRGGALQGRALCRGRRRLLGRAACRARRLDMVHRLGRLDVPRRHRGHSRPSPRRRRPGPLAQRADGSVEIRESHGQAPC
jgi:hypothetical protein